MVELMDSPASSPPTSPACLPVEVDEKPKKKSKKVKKDSATKKIKTKKEKSALKTENVSEAPPTKKKKLQNSTLKDTATTPVNEVDENSPESLGDFSKFRISDKTISLLKNKGITYLFPIQYKTFDHVYDGKDVVAQARTGTGKTMSFVLPLVEKLMKSDFDRYYGRAPQVIIMTPTRELSIQVHNDFQCVSQSLKSVCIYGGAPYRPQEMALRSGVDVVVGTPGRIMDHIEKNKLVLSSINHIVLDEVDRMLDMGFAPAVEDILKHAFTKERENPPQTLLFSATCPPWVSNTARKYLRHDDTVRVDTIGQSLVRTATTVQHLAIRCQYRERAECIGSIVRVYSGQHGRCMIFTETKKEANELSVCNALKLHKAQVLHGDIEQRQREITLKAYRDGNIRCLVATNVAARGLDIPEIDLVIQASPPNDVESYIHRSGRTGRAGRNGICICFYKPMEDRSIAEVERKAGIKFKRIGPPQPEEIVKASVKDAMTSIAKSDKSLTRDFMKQAQVVADSAGGPLKALASALVCMSGANNLKKRSLLDSQENFTTWHFESKYPISHSGMVYSLIEQYLGPNLRNQCIGLSLTADEMGAVFDLPHHATDEVLALCEDSDEFTLKHANTLPELKEVVRSFGYLSNSRSRYGGSSRGGRRFGGGGGGSWGGNRRGRGVKRSWGR